MWTLKKIALGLPNLTLYRKNLVKMSKSGLEVLQKRIEYLREEGSPREDQDRHQETCLIPTSFSTVLLIWASSLFQRELGIPPLSPHLCSLFTAPSTWSQQELRSSCHSGNSPNVRPSGDHPNFPHPKGDSGCVNSQSQ